MTAGVALISPSGNASGSGKIWSPNLKSGQPAWVRFRGGESSQAQMAQSQDIAGNVGKVLGTPLIGSAFCQGDTFQGPNVNGVITNFYPAAATAFTLFMACQVPGFSTVSPNANYAQLAGNQLETPTPASIDWHLAGAQTLILLGVTTSLAYAGGNPTAAKLYAAVYRPGVNQQIYDLTGGTSATTANAAALAAQGSPLQVGSYGPGLSGYGSPNTVFAEAFFPYDLTAFGTGTATDFAVVAAAIRGTLAANGGPTV